MQKTRMAAWWKHVWVALAYAAAYWLFRKFSFTHWILFSGLRLSALFFLPKRYWAAIAIGEILPLSHLAITCVAEFGIVWALLIVFPTPVLAAMPLISWCQRRFRMLPASGPVRMGPILITVALVSALWTLMSTGRLALTNLPPSYEVEYAVVASCWFVGHFMGVLTIVPVALMAREVWLSRSHGQRCSDLLESRLLMDVLFLIIPAVSLMLWITTHMASSDSLQILRIAGFLPVAFLALRHGWHGAAIGGTLASLAEILTITSSYDIEALQAEAFIAFAITTMLILGSRITALNERDVQERLRTREALALARKNIAAGERRMQVAAEFLEQARESVRVGYEHMLHRMSRAASEEDRRCVRHVAIAQDQLFRLSDGLYPAGWCDTDLTSALRQGPFARALSEAGIHYWCDVAGALSRLSSGSHLTIYRLVSECVAQACKTLPPTDVRVRLRISVLHGQTWIGLRIRTWTEPNRASQIRLTDVRLRLVGAGPSWEAAEDRVRSYQGRLRQLQLPQHGRLIRATLKDSNPSRAEDYEGGLQAVSF
jgi:glucose-6-phosphate-specific signal transduction histidine kinase